MGTPELIAIGVFLLVLGLVVGPYLLLVVRPEATDQEVLRQRIRTGGGGAAARQAAIGLLKDADRLSVLGPLNRFLGTGGPMAASLRSTIQLAGVKSTPGRIVTGSATLMMAGFSGVAFFVGHMTWLGVPAGLLTGLAPYVVLRIMRVRRLRKFEEQFPEAVDLIARTLRAGHAFSTGLGVAADELPQPVAAEFKLLFDQQNYGLPINDGLKALAQRVPLIDVRFFVTAVLTQRDAGGNLAEVLDNLSAVIRERFKITRQLRVISAHGRLTGLVLGALPPLLGLYLLIRTPENFQILIDEPTGVHMLAVAICLQLLGAFMIYRITRVEY